jgi:uncharacterized membrane protein YczE
MIGKKVLFTDRIRLFTDFSLMQITNQLILLFKIDLLTMLLSDYYNHFIDVVFLMKPKATNCFDNSSNHIFNHVK